MKEPSFTLEMKRQHASAGRAGGKARAAVLTKKAQRAIALKASKAAAKARRLRAGSR
jgi:hypothetical protein